MYVFFYSYCVDHLTNPQIYIATPCRGESTVKIVFQLLTRVKSRCCRVTCVYTVQVVAAKVEQLEVFGQQELFGPEMFDAVTGQIHLHYVRRQVRWDVIQICKER